MLNLNDVSVLLKKVWLKMGNLQKMSVFKNWKNSGRRPNKENLQKEKPEFIASLNFFF